MSWIIVDPKYSTQEGTKVARVDVPFFRDEADYEGLMGKAFEDDAFREWREAGGVVVLATGAGYDKLKLLMDGSVDVTEQAVREETLKLAMERQLLVLKWVRTQ